MDSATIKMMLGTMADPAYWAQVLCAAVFCCAALGFRTGDWKRPAVPIGRTALIALMFLSVHLLLSVLALRFRLLAGVGTWLAYFGGVAAFAAFFSTYEKNARLVISSVVFSAIITVFEMGGVWGRLLEYLIPGFDSLYAKLAACPLLFASGWLLRKRRISRYDVSVHAARLNLTACAVSALSVVVFDVFTVHVFEHGGDAGVSGLMSVILPALYLLNMVCYLMTYQLSREYTSVIDLTAERQMDKSAASLMAVTEGNLAELHKIRHDIENQYSYMRAMIDSGDYSGLRGYIDELTGTFSKPLVPMLDCGNHTMNLIFNMLDAKAKESRVGLDVKAVISPELPFSELDLVKLYTNVVDNAIEACAAEAPADPMVTVTMNMAGEYLFTRVVNPTKKRADFLTSGVPTTKADSRAHGKGMGIARGIVKKYGGCIRYLIENGQFITEFMLCLKEAPNERTA